MKKLKKKKKLALGAYLEENQVPLSQGATLAGQVIQGSADESNKGVSVAGTALSRAGQGAQLGSAFGPWGTVIGGAAGAVEGVVEGSINADKAKSAGRDQISKKNALITKQLINNSKNSIAYGGKLASKLGVIQGGELNQISPDAVEVKANNPSQTDSVELQDAYVDHDEVIDNQNRVFSDELGFAKYAKRLEKQKSKSSRFTAANNHIDNKLDELFQIQEQTKEGMKQGTKTKKAKGGYLTLTGPFPMKKLKGEGPVKYNFDEGGDLGEEKSIDNWMNGEDMASKGSKVDLNKGLTALSTFGPNIVSGLAQKRLQGPAAPQLERSVALQRINPDAQLAEVDREGNLANQLIKNNTAQASDIASASGSILARKLANKNAVYGQNQQLNAGIQAQEAGLNTQIGARNVERTNAFTQGQNDFSNLKQKLTSENVANLSGKILAQGREKNQMQLDKDKMRIDSFKYESGAPLRWQEKMKQTDPEAYERTFGKGFAYGGKLGTREICDEGLLDSPVNIFGLYQKTEPHNAFKFENNEAQNLQSHKEKSKHGKSSHKLAKGGYVGGGETPNDPKPTPQKLSPNDFQRISWKSQGVQDSTGRGSMYQTSYGALNKLNGQAIPQGVQPTDQTYITNPLGLNKLLNPTQVKPAYDISGSVAPQQGQLAHFVSGGTLPTDPIKLLKERTQKRDSVREVLNTQFPNNTIKRLEGMQDYFDKEPTKYKNIKAFATGGMIGLDESLGDARHITQASKAGLSKGGIHIKKSHRGLLHKNLGVKAGHKIPASKLAVHKGDSVALKKRKVFAQNSKKWHHSEGGQLGARKPYSERMF